MSRAFVKEPDEGAPAEDLPERQISEHPNYVTPAGLEQLEQAVGRLETRRLELLEQDDDPADELTYVDRDLRYFTARLESAIPVDMERQPRRKVAFGAAVTVSQPGGKRQTFTIVGEDEADLRAGQDQLRLAARRGARRRARRQDRPLAPAGRQHPAHRGADRLPELTRVTRRDPAPPPLHIA